MDITEAARERAITNMSAALRNLTIALNAAEQRELDLTVGGVDPAEDDPTYDAWWTAYHEHNALFSAYRQLCDDIAKARFDLAMYVEERDGYFG